MSLAAITIPAELVAALRAAQQVAVLTGAGISAESGIPTFRDALTGLWARYDPRELATVEGFRRNPQMVWDWYAERRAMITACAPNPGHRALAALEQRVAALTLITQNIDGLHQAAGSRNIVELHGNIRRVKCFHEDVVVDDYTAGDERPPRCPRCGGPLRPDVVWFGEMLPARALHEALAAARSCDLFLSVGTSGEVEPAASLPFEALHAGATVVEVNPEATPLTPRARHVLSGPAGVMLPALVATAWPAAQPDS
jgi:NAD-dependent deacetylase